MKDNRPIPNCYWTNPLKKDATIDIHLTIDGKLLDKDYGFSALLEKYGGEITEEAKKEIIELIKEDVGYAIDQCKWEIFVSE